MIIVTSDGNIINANSSFAGQGVIALLMEPEDNLKQISERLRHVIFPHIDRATSTEQMLLAVDSLHKHLHHANQ